MAYFSSGTESMYWATQNCDLCQHQDGGCAVWLLHLLHNYDQCRDTHVARVFEKCLSALIPRKPDGRGNERCTMFLAKE